MDIDHPLIVHFATELRRLREARGWTQGALAARLGAWKDGAIGHIENHRRVPTLKFAMACDMAFELPRSFELLVRNSGVSGDDTSHPFQPWVELEKRATVLSTWQGKVWPGLLQTEKYAYAINSAWVAVDGTRDPAADAADRVKRQEIFDQTPPPSFTAVVDESVLYQRIGGPQVMRGQLEHVLDMSERPRVSVQILPADLGEHVGLLGAFMLARFGDDTDTPDMVYLETADKGEIARDPERFERMSTTFDTLRTDAHNARSTRDMIRRVITKWTD